MELSQKREEKKTPKLQTSSIDRRLPPVGQLSSSQVGTDVTNATDVTDVTDVPSDNLSSSQVGT